MRSRGSLSTILVATLGLLPAACGGSRQKPLPRFPIGIYGPADPGVLPRLKAAGFDTYHTYAFPVDTLKPLAAEARRLGMHLVIYPNDAQKGPRADTSWWPVSAWYLEDEPEVSGISPQKLEAMSTAVREWDSSRPQTFVIGEGSAAQKYALIGDALMLDWYPVPHLPLDSVADQLDTAIKALPAGKPVWMVVQAFDWRDSVQRDPKKPRIGRFPNFSEMRFMSYLSVMHGARGLFYYRLQKGATAAETLLEYPELWQAVARVSSEMRAMQPIFSLGKSKALPFSPTIDAPEARAWSYRGRDYVVLANRSGDKAARLPELFLDTSWRPLFEVRRNPRDILIQKDGGCYLQPLRVMVFEGPWSFRRWYETW